MWIWRATPRGVCFKAVNLVTLVEMYTISQHYMVDSYIVLSSTACSNDFWPTGHSINTWKLAGQFQQSDVLNTIFTRFKVETGKLVSASLRLLRNSKWQFTTNLRQWNTCGRGFSHYRSYIYTSPICWWQKSETVDQYFVSHSISVFRFGLVASW